MADTSVFCWFRTFGPIATPWAAKLALAGMLEQLGKDVWIVNGFAVPPNLRFLDPGESEAVGGRCSGRALDDREVIIVLDTSAWVQVGAMADVIRGARR